VDKSLDWCAAPQDLQSVEVILESECSTARFGDDTGARIRAWLTSVDDESRTTSLAREPFGSRTTDAIEETCAGRSQHDHIRTPLTRDFDDGLLGVADPNRYRRLLPEGCSVPQAALQDAACKIRFATDNAQRQFAANYVQEQQLGIRCFSQPKCLLQRSIGSCPKISRAQQLEPRAPQQGVHVHLECDRAVLRDETQAAHVARRRAWRILFSISHSLSQPHSAKKSGMATRRLCTR
jgi:hypothetical protein